MKRVAAAVVLILVAAAASTGCAVGTGNAEQPLCSTVGRPGSPPVILMAQSVPTAALIPCVSLVPAGWSLQGFNARDGRADFRLASDLAGSHAVDVVLLPGCDTRGATQVPTDQTGATRWERIRGLTGGFTGTRYYTFRGGCVRYDFALHGPSRAAPVNDVSLAVDFVTRTQLRAVVAARSHGRLHLDP